MRRSALEFCLTDEQQKAVDCAKEGHNLLLSGKAGTGKSYVVNAFVKAMKSRGRSVVVVCSSGIACTVYDKSVKSSTVHSFYALQTADMPADMLIERSKATQHCATKIKAANVIIWDEAGMSSKRMFELVNAVHRAVADAGNISKPFGGKQVILVGDFLQLRPVPNLFDSGDFMFTSELFTIAIPHRFELTRLIRQADANMRFVQGLQQIRMGSCTPETETYLRSLCRPIRGPDDHVHIYFKKLSVQLHNLHVLEEMPGERLVFPCEDNDNVRGISCPAEVKLILKPGAKVMLVWNVSEQLKNGSPGTFLRSRNGFLEVEFPNQGVVPIKMETWSKRNRAGRVIGTRTQFPIVLFYASTCHKVQGLTLPGAVVHCTKEFVPGLIYVAASRVKHEDNLQLLNFSGSQLLRPSEEAMTVCQGLDTMLNDNCTCCRKKELAPRLFAVCDRGEEFADDDRDAPESLPTVPFPDGLVSSFFEADDDQIVIDLAQVHQTLHQNEAELASLPECIRVEAIIEEQRNPRPMTEFARTKNTLLEHLMTDCMARLQLFARIQWLKVFQMFNRYLKNNLDDLYMSRNDLSQCTSELYVHLIGSVDFRRELRALFVVEELIDQHFAIGSATTNELFTLFVHELSKKVVAQHQSEGLSVRLCDMPIEGIAKIRHVGGWAIRKELERWRTYVRTNMTSAHPQTRRMVRSAHEKCMLLEENIIVQYSWLQENTNFPGTLEVTEDRQYRERGLIHISDACFECFKRIEERRLQLMNETRLQQSDRKDQFVDDAINEIRSDDGLLILWDDMFEHVATDNQGLVQDLLNGLIIRYMRMASCQFLKDFRRAHNLRKSAEHRKRVLQRKQVAAVRSDHVTYQEIVRDKSQSKVSSHQKLSTFASKHGADGMAKVYLKAKLHKLCLSYGVTTRVSDPKLRMARALLTHLSTTNFNGIPYPCYINQLRSETTVSSDNRVVLRITRDV